MKVSRRDFLHTASASFGVTLLDRLTLANDLENTIKEIRANLLEMVNEERAIEKVPPVALDDLATRVATKHAQEMALGEFASHWGRDGLKPYHRYSFAGGTEATEENVSAADNTWSMKEQDLKQDTAYLHVRLYSEKPPSDGHRRTILSPQHTHVGFGIAVEQLRLRLVELFVAKYVEVEPVRRQANRGATVSFSGKMFKSGYFLDQVEVLYEPTPKAPELSWLREPRSYSLPKESRVLRPKLTPPLVYADRVPGVIDVSTDRKTFHAPVRLFKDKPGIYTIVAWIRSERSKRVFPATAVCVEAR